MHFQAPTLSLLAILLSISSLPLTAAQIAAGGGAAPAATTIATQDSPVRQAPSLFTLNGVTSASYIMFTQTFATTALGSWPLGATPRPGTIGLGDIQGQVGEVKTGKHAKRTIGLGMPLPTGWF